MISPIVRKWTIYSLVTTAAAAWICFLVSFFYFHDGHLPHYPQPSMGRIYESNNHGKVYLTTGRIGSTPGKLSPNRLESSLRYSIGKTKDIAAEQEDA